MYIHYLYIDGFKRLRNFSLKLNERLNLIVGNNETGKSSLLEAINLVLSRQYNGLNIDYAIDPYLFNSDIVSEFFEAIRNGDNQLPPSIYIEAYFTAEEGDPELSKLKGRNNSRNEDCSGVKLKIEVDSDHLDSLKEYVTDESNPVLIPVEYYKCVWRSFADNSITIRNLPLRSKIIDTSLPRIHRGPNRYLSQLIDDALTENQRRELSLAYRKLRHGFAQEAGVQAINEHLLKQGNSVSKKNLSVEVDLSSRAAWNSSITAHLDDLPFDCAGKGEQCRVQMRLAIADSQMSRVLLIEEPENHLSHSNLNMLMDEIRKDCVDHQVILSTHSAFVLNKLGIDNLKLISNQAQVANLSELTSGTKDYFMKLPGYDTLRLILARRCILVEGPSDELIVQKAYQEIHGKLPIENGVDVIAVRSLAFKRFLEIAALLKLDVCVVTDNDSNISALKSKYSDYLKTGNPNIKICYETDERYSTLEKILLRDNGQELLSQILEKEYEGEDQLLDYMLKNKTDCALSLFETNLSWDAPEYIINAVEYE